jgi:predicted oxidoreductase
MKAVEMLRMMEGVLKVMSRNDIARDDWRYVGMYEEFVHRRSMRQGVKRIVRDLAEKYGVSIRTVERIRKRMSKDVKW